MLNTRGLPSQLLGVFLDTLDNASNWRHAAQQLVANTPSKERSVRFSDVKEVDRISRLMNAYRGHTARALNHSELPGYAL